MEEDAELISPMNTSKMHLHVEEFELKTNRKLAEKHLCNQERHTQKGKAKDAVMHPQAKD